MRRIDDNLRDALELEQRDPGMMAGSCMANKYGVPGLLKTGLSVHSSHSHQGAVMRLHNCVQRPLLDMNDGDDRNPVASVKAPSATDI